MSDMHIPGGPVEFEFQQRATIAFGSFIREDKIDKQILAAGEEASGLTFWRVDAEGHRWFRRGAPALPVIHGTPPDRGVELCDVEMIEDADDDS